MPPIVNTTLSLLLLVLEAAPAAEKVYAEFRINEIDFTKWDDEGFFDPPTGKPVKTAVEVKGVPGADEGIVFRLPKEDVEIVVANTLDYVNAR